MPHSAAYRVGTATALVAGVVRRDISALVHLLNGFSAVYYMARVGIDHP
jgi:hypothetical protein